MSRKEMTRERVSLRMDSDAEVMAERQAEKLGISKSRYIELVIKFMSKPELMDTWIKMLVAFKETRLEIMKHEKK
jgi:hypothetical protein